LLTDRYELTMLGSALRDGTAQRNCTFEVFARRLPDGRRFGVVGGTGRLLDAIADFRFDSDDVEFLREGGVVDDVAADYLRDYRFRGDIDGYREGELFFPHSPILTVSGSFAEAVVLETLVLSVLNHDCAIASAAARMVVAAQHRPIIEMGSRRTHEQAAIAAARAAYLAGFASTSNLAASLQYGIPSRCCTTTSGPRSPRRSPRSAPAPPCWSTLTTSPRASRTRSPRPDPNSAPSASTAAISASSPPTPAPSWTISARPAPASSSAVISTSSPSRPSPPHRSIPTVRAPPS
jgi:hypothetical protein